MKQVISLRHLFLLVAFLLLTPLVAQAGNSLAESEDRPDPFLVELKVKETQRFRQLGKATVADAVAPPTMAYDGFERLTLQENGAVLFQGEQFSRLRTVATARELETALATVQPGDLLYLQDGVYRGNFVLAGLGTEDKPIGLHGSRQAILEGFLYGDAVDGAATQRERDYVVHLTGSHWLLDGFSVRQGQKGIMTDGAHHNRLQNLEVYEIGHEGVHFRSFSTNNVIRHSWVHDTGLLKAKFGEGIYVGSSVTNWSVHTNGQPDESNGNVIISNLVGPNITAEAVDLKEGTVDGVVANNSFITDEHMAADSWIDVKGNRYEVRDNLGLRQAGLDWKTAVVEVEIIEGWGRNNVIENNSDYVLEGELERPFFVVDEILGEMHLILPPRTMTYTLSELVARYPEVFPTVGPQTILQSVSLFSSHGTTLRLTHEDAHLVRMLSWPQKYVHTTNYFNRTLIQGSEEQLMAFESWNPALGAVDEDYKDGRSYIYQVGGRMDVHYGSFSYLGYEEGSVSGVAWRGSTYEGEHFDSYGDVSYSHFTHNIFGAYTWESLEMHWYRNTFANNISYGFDPHDFSNDFLVEENVAYGNGSHGIIFSRGCYRNTIRNNESYNNAGHGIMIDDGKHIPDSPNPRYQQPVSSDYNIVENNRLTNNKDGIVVEGGIGNIVRNNEILGTHRYGIRLKDNVSETLVVGNTVAQSDRSSVFVYNNSHDNHFSNNSFDDAQVGIVLKQADNNTFVANQFAGLETSGIVFKQSANENVIQGNRFRGKGSFAVRLDEGAVVATEPLLEGNDFTGWKFPPPQLLVSSSVSIWLILLLIPPLIWLYRRLFKKDQDWVVGQLQIRPTGAADSGD